jgi:hypothetical protein
MTVIDDLPEEVEEETTTLASNPRQRPVAQKRGSSLPTDLIYYKNNEIKYPSCNNLFTEESRSIAPAWMIRDYEQVDWYYPPLNPQENTCYPFETNLSTRILEKDYFTPKRDCVVNETNNYLPTSFNLIKGGFVGGPNSCNTTNSCQFIK